MQFQATPAPLCAASSPTTTAAPTDRSCPKANSGPAPMSWCSTPAPISTPPGLPCRSRNSSTRCRCASAWPKTPTTTCRCWSRPTGIRRIGGVEVQGAACARA
ncbi:UNVERIFIED_CONTAM: hypothetical protein GTU68_057837 [Idotea baltica]|nr:hypothetical protein [Idotea baltica]